MNSFSEDNPAKVDSPGSLDTPELVSLTASVDINDLDEITDSVDISDSDEALCSVEALGSIDTSGSVETLGSVNSPSSVDVTGSVDPTDSVDVSDSFDTPSSVNTSGSVNSPGSVDDTSSVDVTDSDDPLWSVKACIVLDSDPESDLDSSWDSSSTGVGEGSLNKRKSLCKNPNWIYAKCVRLTTEALNGSSEFWMHEISIIFSLKTDYFQSWFAFNPIPAGVLENQDMLGGGC